GRKTAAGSPDRPFCAIGGHINDRLTRECRRTVSHDPTRVGSYIAMRSPCQVHDAVQQQESRSFFILLGIEVGVTVRAVLACTWELGGHVNGSDDILAC